MVKAGGLNWKCPKCGGPYCPGYEAHGMIPAEWLKERDRAEREANAKPSGKKVRK